MHNPREVEEMGSFEKNKKGWNRILRIWEETKKKLSWHDGESKAECNEGEEAVLGAQRRPGMSTLEPGTRGGIGLIQTHVVH